MIEFYKNKKLFLTVFAHGSVLVLAAICAVMLHFEIRSVSALVGLPAASEGGFASLASHSMRTMFLLGTAILVFAGIVIPSVIKREDENASISNLAKNFEKQAVTDTLTELPNRRYFEQAFDAYLKEFNRLGKNFGLLVLDLDHFKSVNDTHGHDIGDLVLREVALRLNAITRDHDIVARLGGEEFAVLTPYTSDEQLLSIAERYRSSIESLRVDIGKVVLRPTISIGVAVNDEKTTDINYMFKQADFKLYEAKRSGRNRVAA